jgi:hypothetical protein
MLHELKARLLIDKEKGVAIASKAQNCCEFDEKLIHMMLRMMMSLAQHNAAAGS